MRLRRMTPTMRVLRRLWAPYTSHRFSPAVLLLLLVSCDAASVPEGQRSAALRLVPELRLGDDEDGSAFQFVRIAGVVVDGQRVYVRDEGSQFVRQFDSGGRFVRNVGRPGAGPGEFQGLFAIGTLADTLWAIDVAQRRVSMFNSDGRFIRSWPLDKLGQAGSARADSFFSMPLALTSDGEMLGFGGTTGRAIADGRVTASPVYRMARSGAVIGTLTWVSIRHSDMVLRSASAMMYRAQPFADNPLLACDGANRRVIVIQRSSSDRRSAASFRATAINLLGDTLWSTVVPVAPVPISRTARDSVREAVLRAIRPRFAAAELDRALFLPEFATPVTAAIVAADGSTWLRGADAGGSVRYYVLDRNGSLTGLASGNPSTRLLWVSDRMAWGEEVVDEVPTLVRLRIERTALSGR